MRTPNLSILAPDRRTAAERHALFGAQAARRASDLRYRRELVMIERVGNSIIVVTHFD